MSDFNFIPQGWECPKCKRVYSPTTMMCIACPQYTTGTTGTQTTPNLNLTTSSTTYMMHSFEPTEGKTSKTKCKICGLEKWQHPNITYTNTSN